MSNPKLVEVVTEGYLHKTPLAVKLGLPGGKHVWIPFSELDNHDDNYEHIVIPEWLALDKELDDYITGTEIRVW